MLEIAPNKLNYSCSSEYLGKIMWKNPLDDVYACTRRGYLTRLLSGADAPDVYVRTRRRYLTRLSSGASVIDART